MSKTTETKKKAPAAKSVELGPTMSGSEILVACLEREGVDTIFAYPGGASMEIHQALTRSKKIRTVLPRHEQGGAFAADGYARATGRAGVCMATSGPGATNLVTGIADAYMDSVPLVAITGQVPQAMIGKGAFQETDIFGMTLPVVKHSYLITDINDIPRIVKEAFLHRADRPARPGADRHAEERPAGAHPAGLPEGSQPARLPARQAGERPGAERDHRADREIRAAGALRAAAASSPATPARNCAEFAEATQIPVTTTLMGCGAFPETHPLSLRWLGMHGAAFANWAVNGEFEPRKSPTDPMKQIAPGADLLLAFGVRFDDRVTGKVDKFCETRHDRARRHRPVRDQQEQAGQPADHQRHQVRAGPPDRDDQASGRCRRSSRPGTSRSRRGRPRRRSATGSPRRCMKSQHMRDHLKGRESEVILPQMAIEMLYELTKGEAIITTGVGQHQMWAGQFYKFKYPRQFLTSAGLGAMGYGYPAALGAKVAFPDRQVVDIDGDGSFLMNVQELATAHIEKIAAKAIILNNQHLGMVMQWEDRFYAGNRGNTYLGDPENRKQIYPDYIAVCNSFNVKCERVMYKKDLRAAMQRMLDADEPYVLDIIVPYTEHVLPFIPAGKTVADMIWQA